jgi:hypothetical protein
MLHIPVWVFLAGIQAANAPAAVPCCSSCGLMLQASLTILSSPSLLRVLLRCCSLQCGSILLILEVIIAGSLSAYSAADAADGCCCAANYLCVLSPLAL